MSSKILAERCPCGRPLHYNNQLLRAMIEELIANKGPYIIFRVGVRRWKVPRHYAALHNLNSDDLPNSYFEELLDEED